MRFRFLRAQHQDLPRLRFRKRGQRNSVARGLKLDALYQARELQWKLKMAVSGCMNDCTEACIRDNALLGTTNGGAPEQGLPEHIPSEEEVRRVALGEGVEHS